MAIFPFHFFEETQMAAADKYYAKKRQNSYERFFEGYEEAECLDPSGRRKIIRIYTAEYYRMALTKKERLMRKILYPLLAAAATVLFILAALRPSVYNNTWYAVIPEAFFLACALFLDGTVFGYVSAPERMEIRTYKRSAVRLPLACKLLCAAVVPLLCSVGAYVILDGWACAAEMLPVFVLFLLAGACPVVILLLEKKVHYELLPNKAAGK